MRKGYSSSELLFNKNILNSKLSQTNLIVTILVIVIALVGVLLVFNIVRPLVTEKSGNIESSYENYRAALAGDSDNDGYTDDEEIAAGTNPQDPNSHPNTAPLNTPISSCRKINATGNYYLARNLSGAEVTADCIYIKSSNVNFDCAGNSIKGTNSILIYNDWQNNNTIKNCNLESGNFGITSYGNNNKILNNKFVSFTSYGIRSQGNNNLIENNYLDNSAKAIAIEDGDFNIIQNNFVKNSKWGLSSWRAESNQFINNKVSGNSYGVLLYDSSNTVLECGTILNNSINDVYVYPNQWYNPFDANNNIVSISLTYLTKYIGSGAQWHEMVESGTYCSKYCSWTGEECIGNEENVKIARSISGNSVTLFINYQNLEEGEILMIAEQIGAGTIIDSTINPTYNFEGVAVWLFSPNPPQTLGSIEITSTIPNSFSYTVSGSSSGISGKWALSNVGKEGVIENAE